MLRERLSRYRDRVRRELTTAFREEHSPHEVGLSYSIGTFVTAMPTGGLGIGLLAGLAAWLPWISKPAIVASIVVLNPLVKPAVYVASYQTGGVLLGNQSLRSSFDADYTSLTEAAGVAIKQLLIGNLVIAALLSISSYALVVRLTRAHRERKRERSGRSLVSVVVGLFRRS